MDQGRGLRDPDPAKPELEHPSASESGNRRPRSALGHLAAGRVRRRRGYTIVPHQCRSQALGAWHGQPQYDAR